MKHPTLAEVQYARLPKKARKSAISYIKYRIAGLDLSMAEAELRPEFHSFKDFLFGRSVEAKEILEMLQYQTKIKMGKK